MLSIFKRMFKGEKMKKPQIGDNVIITTDEFLCKKFYLKDEEGVITKINNEKNTYLITLEKNELWFYDNEFELIIEENIDEK